MINIQFKGIFLQLPEKCVHCLSKLSIWKGVESDHVYVCLYCNYVQGDCCEGVHEPRAKYHYHPVYKVKNNLILDHLNEKEGFSDDLYDKKGLFKCPMIPTDDDPKQVCRCGKEA